MSAPFEKFVVRTVWTSGITFKVLTLPIEVCEENLHAIRARARQLDLP